MPIQIDDSNRYVPYVDIYLKVYFVGGLALHSILLILIRTKSPSSLAFLKYFLYNTSILQVFLIICGYFSQHRSLSNKTSFAVLSNGPCRSIGADTCFSTYHIFVVKWNKRIFKPIFCLGFQCVCGTFYIEHSRVSISSVTKT